MCFQLFLRFDKRANFVVVSVGLPPDSITDTIPIFSIDLLSFGGLRYPTYGEPGANHDNQGG